jgi:hypothetical protein
MSMHKILLTDLEREGLSKHHLVADAASQIADSFRLGMKWALDNSSTDGWISAKVSPPKKSCQVIAEWSNGDIEQSSYITDWGKPHFQRKCGTDENGTGWTGNVGHVVNWMPLPKAASCGK